METEIINYFGTELESYGHYIFQLDNDRMDRIGIRFDHLPFSPENLTNNLPKGEVIFYQGGGFTVIGISGSCKDDRNGTKSIFWVKEIITFNELKDRILNHPVSQLIIKQMPFTIQWND